ncbi:MAG: winged helix-turn-helix domain-containing protein [Proteobacteria bacterium]|nr:winged helix-turn-helix domain-containing protein [Pseudomonadota bacterium]MBU1708844.1 winged helix-turn-helix domain-containing protein [Pseudomonadota bacterium]
MRINTLFSKDYLLGELYPAAVALKRDDYVYFHADAINQGKHQIAFDFLTVNILNLTAKGLPDGGITSQVAYAARSSIITYERNLTSDSFTPLTMLIPGTAIFAETIKPMDEWEETDIWHSHCIPQEFHWVAAISYQYPHHKKTVITFHYIKAKGAPFHWTVNEDVVEYFTFPYYLGWLHQYGAICHETLKEWLSLLVGMSLERFKILRALTEFGMGNARQLSDNLCISQSTVYKHLENSFDNLLVLEPGRQQLSGNANRILSLANAYHFMGFGAASSKRLLPKRKV